MSVKTVAQKLGLKGGMTLLVRLPPDGVAALIGALPFGAGVIFEANKPSALILMFARDKAALAKGLPACKRQLAPGGGAVGCLRQGYVRPENGHQPGQHSRVRRNDRPRYGIADRPRR
jgi:hypothetical protein